MVMDVEGRVFKKSCSNSSSNSTTQSDQEEVMVGDLKRGPWTADEDFKLMNYIAIHGEGRWNSLAHFAGLKRTGKSCRLRWLNYLRPDVRRGNITLEEQLLILELHSRWGNRWSKIAQHLPGRTDNEIKNYWRTRVQKHAKQLKCDVNSKQFKDAMKYVWMPRLIEKIQAASGTATATATANATMTTPTWNYNAGMMTPSTGPGVNTVSNDQFDVLLHESNPNYTSENSSDYRSTNPDNFQANYGNYNESLISPTGYFNQGLDLQWLDGVDLSDSFWNIEDVWLLEQQQIHNM